MALTTAKRGCAALYLAAALMPLLSGCATSDLCPAAAHGQSGGSGAAAASASSPSMELPGTGQLRAIAGNSRATHAVILIGGIHDTYRYFEGWENALASRDNLVLGWDHDHRSMPMAQSAVLLARDIDSLGTAGITNVTLVAHSIGGLVAKGAIDALSRSGEAHAFNHINLHALGTPWAGFRVMRFALSVPGSRFLSTLAGYPMAFELSPDSDFLASVRTPMPANGKLHLYHGDGDNVALPAGTRMKSAYALLEAQAATITTIEGFRHNDYKYALALADRARLPDADRPCLHKPCRLVAHFQGCPANTLAAASLH